jgi:hypothetical protein
LPLVGDFVRATLFRLPFRNVDFAPGRLERWATVILAARNRYELEAGDVVLATDRGKSYGFGLKTLARQIQSGKIAHSRRLEELRRGKLTISSPERWATAVLKDIGAPVNPSNSANALSSLDAALRYDSFLYSLAKDHSYEFARHDSDGLDSQQLYYLADPLVHFVTCDTDFKNRTRGTSQANRILSFKELKTMVRSESP